MSNPIFGAVMLKLATRRRHNVTLVRLAIGGREVLIRKNVHSGDVKCGETGNEEYFPPRADNVVHADPLVNSD